MTVTGTDDNRAPLHDADRLYAARSAMADAASGQVRIGVAELVRYVTDASNELPAEALRALFASPRLRADFQRLKRSLRLGELPALAAASAGSIASRTFEGGSARVHASRIEGQVYVVFQFFGSGPVPRALLLESSSEHLVKRPLPAPDTSGQVLLVLDRSNPGDELFLQLFSDPTATGSFVS